MNLNIQKAKIFVEERLAIVQYAGMWSEVKTRYGTSLVYTNDRWADQGILQRNFKVSFNGKSITVAEKFEGVWKLLIELNEKACNDFSHVKDVLVNFTPPLSNSEIERAARRAGEAYRALEGSTGGDVAVTVSAGAAKAPEAASEPVKAPRTPMHRGKPKGRLPKPDASKRGNPVVQKEIVIESAGTAVVEGAELPVVKISENELLESGDMKFSPANHEQSVGRAKRESPHKVAMIKLVTESGIPFVAEPSKNGMAYSFENITITFSGTMLKVSVMTDCGEKTQTFQKPEYATWISGKYDQAQIEQIVTVLAIAKECARLRAMACFSMPEISFTHSESNFITDAHEPVHYRTRVTYITINYRVDGFNHDGYEHTRVKSIRYTRDEIMATDGKHKMLQTEKTLTASVSYSKSNASWGDRYYNAKAPTKRMSIECEEVSYVTNRDLLVSFGLKISNERRDKEYYTVNVPLDRVPTPAIAPADDKL